MCTLIVLHRCVPGRPLVIAANRDEFLARRSEPPAIRARANGPILAPLDAEAGGTWLGLNGRGVFVGLTNLRPESSEAEPIGEDVQPAAVDLLDAAEAAAQVKLDVRSRGEVVMRALDARSANEAAEWIANLELGAYNPFQLLVADAERAWLTVYRDAPRTRALSEGIHVVGNVEDDRIGPVLASREQKLSGSTSAADSEHPRVRKLSRIRGRVEEVLAQQNRDLLEGLAGICREHVEANPFESTCVHVPVDVPVDVQDDVQERVGISRRSTLSDRYGTRSSLLLEMADEASMSRLMATDGPPCDRPFEDLSVLLKELTHAEGEFAALGSVAPETVGRKFATN